MAATATTTSKPATKAKSANGVSKGGPSRSAKKANTKAAMVKMQAFFKAHRHEYKDLPFKEQQKKLGAEWKTSKENPKVSGAA